MQVHRTYSSDLILISSHVKFSPPIHRWFRQIIMMELHFQRLGWWWSAAVGSHSGHLGGSVLFCQVQSSGSIRSFPHSHCNIYIGEILPNTTTTFCRRPSDRRRLGGGEASPHSTFTHICEPQTSFWRQLKKTGIMFCVPQLLLLIPDFREREG